VAGVGRGGVGGVGEGKGEGGCGGGGERERERHCLALDDKEAGLQQHVLHLCVCARVCECVCTTLRPRTHALHRLALDDKVAVFRNVCCMCSATCVACVGCMSTCVYARPPRTHTRPP